MCFIFSMFDIFMAIFLFITLLFYLLDFYFLSRFYLFFLAISYTFVLFKDPVMFFVLLGFSLMYTDLVFLKSISTTTKKNIN